MNRKWSGSVVGVYLILLVQIALLISSCSKGIPGNPVKTVKDYIEAVQKSDFETIYRLNRSTARQKKFIEKSKNGNVEQELKENFKSNKAAYDVVEPGFYSGAQWAEKYYFPPASNVVVGEARNPSAAEGDSVNVKYETGFTVLVSVKTFYTKSEDAPELDGQKVKEAIYDCILGKIRYGANVRIYSHDEQWFVSGFVLDRSSVKYFELKKTEK